MRLVLASTSPYRRELLSRLRLPFEVAPPLYDEGSSPDLTPSDLALHNALKKAESLVPHHPGAVVIGSDQTAELDGRLLGKPGTPAPAVEQLRAMRGRVVRFNTGLAVLSPAGAFTGLETVDVKLRELGEREILSYVAMENPVDCAGSFKIEGLGIALMESVTGRDYTALIGLPLIMLTEFLGKSGVNVLSPFEQ